ncbi:hypothetical protein CGRA01v4_11633 [Colletotrichum graminicola]|uniref:DUF3433 domain-containing protein n=1 Tax=Colletotrichum graminicola (strain M1.001 / M2 / FGSC 10212) TaxID=645133 RepID=E3QEA9_COLGM|nr:uncharacterized protein GLRG_04341 [Colletotrichum graminicola M1.001]EFQ29197.1 hypothetical protein GLRG_04341 [Colletotrichum graminicola M1.001]WDK20346.1 hypothetical protein CGRA01v4_11633 [Colletotrichum graminicola]
MTYNGDFGASYRTPEASEPGLNHRLSSNLTKVNDLDSFTFETTAPPVRARHSIASVQSYSHRSSLHDSDDTDIRPATASLWPPSFPYSGASGYESLSPRSSAPSRSSSHASRKVGRAISRRGEKPIPEEGHDLSLLRSAAAIGRAPQDDAVLDDEPIFDVTATLGPMGFQDEAFVKKLQEQEARGFLTGGLGAGFKPDTTIKREDLFSPESPKRSLTRSFTRRPSLGRPSLGRRATIKDLGQDEANKRGEVIEVIMEEQPQPSPGLFDQVDLSVMTGPNIGGGDGMRQATFPANKGQKTQVFYPQPNWKPFPMRWPYLTGLISLSIALAIMVEFLFQRSRTHPLVQFQSPAEVPALEYFAVKFLPTILSVVYGVLWQVTDFEVKRLEAYYQLSKEGGALAAESLNVDYVTCFSWLRPIRAIKLRHFAVAASSIATSLAVSLVPTFGSAAFVLYPDRATRLAHPNGDKEIRLQAVWARLLSSTLCVCAFFGCVLIYILQRRRSGLLADVKGIAGLASMAVVSHILVDFADLDVVSHRDIHARLKHRRYVLRNASLAPDDENPASSQETDRFKDDYASQNPHPRSLRPHGFLPFIIGILLFLGFIPVFLFSNASVITAKAPWIVTALAVSIKLGWGGLETDMRMMEPYYILSKRHSPSKTLTLDYTAMPFGLMPFQAFFNGHMLMFLVGFGSMMAEVLTVLLTGLATVVGTEFLEVTSSGTGKPGEADDINAGQETVASFWVSYVMATFILLYMGAVSTVVFLRRRHPFLPRQPNTIASHLAYIHQSKMIYDFVGTSKLSNAGMVRHLEKLGKTYGLGWFEGRDGQTHCGVDQEELLGGYKHGMDFQGTNKPWNQQWDSYD